MSLLAKNLFITLLQGTQSVTKTLFALHAFHTSSTNTDEHKDNSSRNYSTLQSRQCCAKVTLIPGDGVGPELMNVIQEIFKAMDSPVEFETIFLSEVNPSLSAPLDDVVKSVQKNQVCIKGGIAHPNISLTGELATLNMKLRTALDLYANVVHVQTLPNVKGRHKDVDCVIVREQTEGEYSALEHEAVPGVVECLKIVTARKSLRIAKFAFDYAVKNNRKKVTCVHKANIMKLGDGLFLKSCEDMATLYPRIKFEKMIVDNCTMQIVSNPHQFDVMVTPNLYGNIVANVAAGLVGGAGLVPGASYSSKCAVFEQGARHIFSEAVGKNIANPTAIILCAVEMLIHMNLPEHSRVIKDAVNKVLLDGKVRTSDLGGNSSTQEFTKAVIDNLDIK